MRVLNYACLHKVVAHKFFNPLNVAARIAKNVQTLFK